MNGRTIARALLALVLIAGVVGIGIGAYNAGVSQGLVASGHVVAAPDGYVGGPYAGGYGYGWGWGGPGFGFFGFLGFLLFFFLLIGLVRAAFGRGRGWGRREGWGGPGHEHGSWRGSPWESRAREIHDEWHRTGDDQSRGGGAGAPPA